MTLTQDQIDPAVRRPVEGAKNRTEGHLWLHRLVGEWTCDTEWTMPDGSVSRATSTESVRKLGEYWVVTESVGAMPDDGAEFRMIVSLGYDHRKGGFVGSWVGSAIESLWVYSGALDSDGTLNLDAEGEDMMDESKTATYRDTVRFDGEDVVRTSSVRTPDGWVRFMESRSRRVG